MICPLSFLLYDINVIFDSYSSYCIYNRTESSVLRLINASLAGKLVDEAIGSLTLFECLIPYSA